MEEKEVKVRLSQALEFLRSAQGHLLENVRPNGDPMAVADHYSQATSMLINAAGILSPLSLGGTRGVTVATELGFRLVRDVGSHDDDF